MTLIIEEKLHLKKYYNLILYSWQCVENLLTIELHSKSMKGNFSHLLPAISGLQKKINYFLANVKKKNCSEATL